MDLIHLNISIGFNFLLHKIINEKSIKYEVDSGQYLFVKRFNKYIVNPYRDKKTFTTLTKAKEYIKTKLGDQKKKKKEKKT